MSGALLATLLAATPAVAQTPYEPVAPRAAGVPVCPGGICGPEALEPWFRALSQIEAGRRDQPAHLLQLGDSHTAGDRITGAVRARLQARFGNGGRGVLAPGTPYAGYAPYQVEVSATDWSLTTAALTPRAGYGAVGVGLAGTRSAFGPSPTLFLRFDPGSEVGRLGLCGRVMAEGTRMTVRADGTARDLHLTGWEGRVDCVALDLGARSRELVLTDVKGEGPYDLFVTTGRPGVIVSNLGVSGATLRDLAARDPDIAAAELAFWRPDLIVLAFGTNEGFEDDLDAMAYERLLRAQIARLRRLTPGAGLLILGAPDALRNGAAGGCSADGRRAPPPSLAVVRDVQRRVSEDLGVAYWDWYGRMGGACSADGLALATPALMRGDRVHFTSEGADWIGGVLADDLTRAYDAWRDGEGR